MYRLTATDLTQRFGPRTVFSHLQITLATGQSLAVTGPNGAGKTTLLLTLLSIYRPAKGDVVFLKDDTRLDESALRSGTALVAPYLTLYDQLTAEENLKFFACLSGVAVTGKRVNEILSRVGLEGRGCDPVAAYSSGMKQRLKYALALMRQPAVLLLDEPGANLDAAGREMARDIVAEFRTDRMVIIATNDTEEAALAEQQLRLGE